MLTGLAVGSYSIAAAPVTGSGTIVGTVDTATVTGSPSAVAVGSQDTATVTYAARPGSGGLWVANFGAAKTVLQYTAAQLASSTSAAAATALGTGSPNLFGAAIDANGKLWVSTFSTDSIIAYSTSQLGTSGSPTPAIVLVEPGTSEPAGLAFDANGNLWVANYGGNVVEFTASQLASSGSPTPAVTITPSGSSLNGPTGLAFDASGTLWVANGNDSTVVAYKASQLTAGGALTPSVIVTGVSKAINGPLMIAFDANGNLWVTNGNYGLNTVVAFSPGQLASSGTPTPVVTLSANSGSLAYPAGIAFDASGDMWVANYNGNSLVEFTPSQLVTSGNPTPTVTVTGSSLSGPFGLAFDPHATGLPIMQARRR
jgi:sugar lactone lactonase YvrE